MKQFLSFSLMSLSILTFLTGCSSDSGTSSTAPVVVGPAPSIEINPNPPAIEQTESSDTVDLEENESDLPEDALEELPSEDEDGEEEVDVVSSPTVNYTSSAQKIIQLEPYFLVADQTTGEAYHLINVMDKAGLVVGQVCDSMYVDIFYGPEHTGDENTLIQETCAMFLIPSSQESDITGAYLSLIDMLSLGNYETISLDLTEATNLSSAEKEALWWLITKAVSTDVPVLLNTKEELAQDGLIVEEGFVNGLYLKLSCEEENEDGFRYTYETWESEEINNISEGSFVFDQETGMFTGV